MENPLLEEVPTQETMTVDEMSQEEAKDEAERLDPLKEIDVEKFFEDYLDDRDHRRTRSSEIPELPPIENTLTETPDLYDHLLWQLHMSVSDELILEIGDAIIQNVDEDGMLRASVEEIANLGPYAPEEVEKALHLVQSLDPPGVAARDLTECLRLQLRHLGLENSPTDVMVRDHVKQLQSHQYAEIGRQMQLTPDEVSHHLEIIKRLDPRPGQKYSPDRSTYIIPDVFVVKEGDDYKIILNDDGLPKLRISPTYRRMLDGKEAGSEETRNYVKEKLRSALWLLKSVDQRQRTIYKVIEGEDPARPLSDSRIAELLGGNGLPLARRTVAKYREELRIPPSNLRKSVH